MRVTPTRIPDVRLISLEVHRDGRGFFVESYNERRFAAAGIEARFVQDNHSRSVRGVLRGLHYQVGASAQAKLIRVLRGEIFDVAVDLRRGSPTFGRWAAATLSADRFDQLYVPEGFAHGFYVPSECAEILYKVNRPWDRDAERTLRWDDPDIGVPWPLQGVEPLLSDKDRRGLPLAEAELFP